MRKLRSYYSKNIDAFLVETAESIFGTINKNNTFANAIIYQRNSWEEEISIFKNQLIDFKERRLTGSETENAHLEQEDTE